MERINEAWSVIHDLALLYLSLAHSADNLLSEAELDTIVSKLSDWQPDAGTEHIQEVIMEVLAVYMQGDIRQELRGSMMAIKHAMPRVHRKRVVRDLRRIAAADGRPIAEDNALINLLARIWEVAPEYASGKKLWVGEDEEVAGPEK